jgi:hypothetical protein
MPERKKPEPSQPRGTEIWVPGEWPPARGDNPGGLVIDWDAGAIVVDCVTGHRFWVRARIQLTHAAGSGETWRPVPAVRGEVIERYGEILRVRFRDGQVVQVTVPKERAVA